MSDERMSEFPALVNACTSSKISRDNSFFKYSMYAFKKSLEKPTTFLYI